jgi:hypothetical protein
MRNPCRPTHALAKQVCRDAAAHSIPHIGGIVNSRLHLHAFEHVCATTVSTGLGQYHPRMKQKQALSHRCVTPARVTKYYKMHTRGFSNPVRHGVAENPINQGRGVSDKSEPQETRLTEETQVKPDERNCGFVSLRPRRFRRNQEAPGAPPDAGTESLVL